MLQFKKKLGFHRGNPRLFFETDKIQPYGFVPGAAYDMALKNEAQLELGLNLVGKRKVCRKGKGDRTLSVIDINSNVLEGFRGHDEVLVTVSQGFITINRLLKGHA